MSINPPSGFSFYPAGVQKQPVVLKPEAITVTSEAKLRGGEPYSKAIVDQCLADLPSPLKMSGGSWHMTGCTAPESLAPINENASLLDNALDFLSSFNLAKNPKPVQVAAAKTEAPRR